MKTRIARQKAKNKRISEKKEGRKFWRIEARRCQPSHFFGSIWFAALSNNTSCPATSTGVVEARYYHGLDFKYCLLQNGILEWKFNPYGQNQRSCRIYQSKHNFVWKNENYIGNSKSTTCLGEEGWGWMGRQGVTGEGQGANGKDVGFQGEG